MRQQTVELWGCYCCHLPNELLRKKLKMVLAQLVCEQVLQRTFLGRDQLFVHGRHAEDGCHEANEGGLPFSAGHGLSIGVGELGDIQVHLIQEGSPNWLN